MKESSVQFKLWGRMLCVFAIFTAIVARAQPVITQEPTNTSVNAGGTASFTVVATGAPTLTYHWRHGSLASSVAAANGTAATLTLANVADSDGGGYFVLVGNGSGTVTSSVAVLTVLNPPVIIDQPLNVVVTNGDEASFSVGANGTNLNYQWMSNSVPLPGETNSTFDLDPVLISDAASYSVVITNPDGSATSQGGLLTVVAQQLTTSQSIAVPIIVCTNLTFTVVTYGTDLPLTYQWYQNGNPVGTDSSNYTISDVQFSSAGTYSVVVSDSQGASATTMASITVTDPPPVVTVWPTNQTLDVNGQCEVAVPDLTSQIQATATCGGLVYSQNPTAGTLVSLGVTNVLVTVTDVYTNSVSTNVTLTIIDSNPSPLATFVDASYSGLPSGTVVTWPYTGGTGTHYVGCDAFPAIQAGINRVAASGTVNVAAGRYVGELTITQPLTLLGPNATNNPNTGPRVAEAVLQPNTSDPEINDYPTYATGISITSSNVTIKGLTVDGFNPDLIGSAYSSGTNYFNAAVGIADYNGDSSIRIENNIIKNDSQFGVDLESDGPGSPPATNSFIIGNLVENLDYNAEGFGMGIILYNNYYAEIAGNSLQNVAIGISPQSYFLANPGDVKGQSICSNTINASLQGIFFNLVYESASTFVITSNTLTFAPTNGSALYFPPEWDGMVIDSIQSAVSVVLSNNIITGPGANVGYNTVGYNIWNTPTTGSVAVIGGSVSSVNYGVWVNDYDGYQSPGDTTTATISGLNISSASVAGVYVQDDPRASTNGVLVQATITSNTVISSSALGVCVQGTNAGASVLNNNASITGNAVGVAVDTGVALLQNNDLRGNTVAGISATNSAIVDAGDCSGDNVTGLGTGSGAHGSSAGGNNLSYGFSGTAPWAIQDVSGCKILAEQDNFGATMPTNIAAAFNDPDTAVIYSQSPAVVVAPASTTNTCDGQVSSPATGLAGFIAQGGYVSVGPASYWQSNLTVTPLDNNYPVVGNGTDLRTYTIADSCSTYTVYQTNTVLNTNLPVPVAQNLIKILDANGNATVLATEVNNGSTDYCDQGVTPLISKSPTGPWTASLAYSCGNTGSQTVYLQVTDVYGNAATTSAQVTIRDTTPPTINDCPGNIIVADPTLNGQNVTWTPPTATDNCSAALTSNYQPGNHFPDGVTTVTYTAVDPSGNSNTCSFTITVVPNAITYVDANYVGLNPGTVVNWPAVVGTGPHYIGYDAFATIQGGVNGLADNGTVNVAAGTYPEVVVISNSLTLLGAQAGQNANTRFAAFTTGPNGPKADPTVESVITAAATAPNSAANDSVHITASSVTIDGFVVDGNNPVLPQDSAIEVGGVNTDSRRAIITEDASGNLFSANSALIKNNIIQNYAQRGVELANPSDTSHETSGSLITGNVIGNYGLDGVLLANNAYSDVTSNTVVMADNGESGIWLQDSGNPGTGTAPTNIDWSFNNVTVCQDAFGGIWVNLFHSSATTINIHDNIVDAVKTVTGADDYTYGIYITSLEGSTTANLSNNIVGTSGGQFARGIALWNLATTTNTVVAGGTVGNAVIGVSLSYNDENFSSAGSSLAANLTGVSISGSSFGALVDATGSGTNTLQMQVSGNTTITNCTTGIFVLGSNASANIHDNTASITGNGVGVSVDTGVALLQNNDLTGNSVAGINVTNGAIVDAGNCTGTNVTGLGISTGGNNLSGYGFDNAAPWAIINSNAGGNPVVLADHDNFGAVLGNNIAAAFSGAVEYAQSPAVIGAPTSVLVVCVSDVPAGATNLAGFNAIGGYFSANAASAVSYTDNPPYPYFMGSGPILRTYTITDKCGVQSTAPAQTITVDDTVPPVITVPSNIVQAVDAGQNYATVNFSVGATDNCGGAGGVQSLIATPQSGSQFPVGTNTVTVAATDYSGNSATNTFTVQVVGLPLITQQPASRTNNAGTTATFTVVATSPTSLSYQWFKGATLMTNGGNISGATNPTLTVSSVSDSDVANYSVTVSNLAGSVISSNASLTVIDPPVIVSVTPGSQTNNATTTATFTVVVTGTAPFGYQWYQNGTNQLVNGPNISGALTNILTLSNVLAANSGLYSVVVTNPAATVTSSNVTLVVVDPWISVQPVSEVEPLGGTASFSVVGVGTAPLTYVWQQGGVGIPGATNSTYTIGTIQDSDAGSYDVIVSSVGGSVTSAVVTLTVTHPPVFVTEPQSQTVIVGQNASFNVTTDGTTPFSYQWQKNLVNIFGATNHTLNLSNVSTNDAGNYDVVVTNTDGSATSTNAVLTVIVPPSFVTQPASLTNDAGTTATFTVVANGSSLAYQWYKGTNSLTDGGNISGSTNAMLTLSNVLGTNGGTYSVVISNYAGPLASSNATLTVIDPYITNEPASQAVVRGSPASFTVGVAGTSPAYQWRKNGMPIIGANSSTYSIASVADSDAASYDVVVTNIYGSATSTPLAVLTVLGPPIITNQPVSVTNNAGTTATFSVVATGTAPLGYQWKKGATNLVDGGNISGSMTATLVISTVSDSDVASYSVVVTNAVGTNISASATLTVIDPPVITNGPVSITNNAETTATFSISVGGTAPFGYQWYKNGTNQLSDVGNVSGSASNILTLSNVLGADRATYSVVVTNPAGTATSTNATLTVIDPVITAQPTNTTAIDGNSVSFSVTAAGTAALSYHWRYDDADLTDGFGISGSGTATLLISDVADSDAGNYSVVITNTEGTATSVEAVLTTVPPLIVSQPTNFYVVVGNPFDFSVEVNGATPFSYQWLQNSTNINNATNRIYSSSSAAFSDAGSYKVIVTNPDGNQTSATAELFVYSNAIPVVIFSGYTNGHATITLEGVPTFTYELQASTNLLQTNWVALETNTSPFIFTDTNSYPQRFYRGLYLP